ncbi:MAG: sigma-70 family RNA polymerase sigma factor [Xenococcaceae cyanobacterium MO_167.B27]|nr:sigma-70 family RNA polymerase sigma factor [Xenococcaceae cyanobacterium MO_167.B27]
MIPRQGIVQIFSTFIQFDFDRFSNWATAPRLRRSMTKCLNETAPKETSENFWAIYWHKRWQKKPQGIAREHLLAYLQEVCFWSTQKTIMGFTSTQYTIPDGFQIAIAGIDKVLKGFDGDRGYNLKSYASITFSNLIRELLRQRQEIDICSEWSLLRKLSQKRLQESLQNAGLSAEVSEKYVLAWNCFKNIYVPERSSATRRLAKPSPEAWIAIANLYNKERRGQLSQPGEAVKPEILEKWLLICVKAARSYLYPNVTSINQPKPGYDSGEIADSLVGEIEDSLLSEMIVEEEVQQRNQQQSQINEILISALAKLKPDEQKLLELYYAQKLKQGDIAKKLSTQQYTISRKLSRARKSLLKSLSLWTKDTLHIYLTSDVLKAMSAVIEEWLESHYHSNPQ